MVKPSRRQLLAAVLGGVGLTIGGRMAVPWLLRRPAPTPLGPELEDFVGGLFEDLDLSRVWDVHAHLVGLGDGSGAFVSPRMRSHRHPILRFQFDAYLAAAGFEEGTPDVAYLDRVVEMQRLGNPDGRVMMMAFDVVVDEHGEERIDESIFHTPTEYVLHAALAHEEVEAIASVHPYREDCVERLEAAVSAGARAIKWLPQSMRIDPDSPLCQPLYDALARLDVPLISHAGEEAAVESQVGHYESPKRLYRALESGVRVIVAHCASLGEDEGRSAHLGFLEMMDEAEYEGRLFGDLSAMTQVNRCGPPLFDVLKRGDLHHRLLNGSDFPLPAVDPLVSTLRLRQLGYIDGEQRRLCNGVYEHNPLLYDLVLKRCLAAEGSSFAPSAFETAKHFSRAASPSP